MKFSKMLTIALAVVLMACLVGTAAAEIKIGVLAKNGAPKCMTQWGPTAEYLTAKVGDQVTIIPLKFEAIEPAVAGGEIDFMLANSAFYVSMEKKHGVKAVTTMINSRNGHALSEFGGVIFTRADSPVQTLEDIRGKKFMVVKKSSFGGAQMAWRLLLEKGIDPQTDCAEFMEGSKHDNVVLAVQNGTAEVGSVRSDTLERMADAGTIKMADFRIINKVDDGFPFVHSTRLYPEWPLAAVKTVDAAVARKVADALMAMTKDDAAATAAKVVGWTTPADYAPVVECLTAIQYGEFATIQ